MTEWECPFCGWAQRAHPVYGWQQHDERAVEVHREILCPSDAPLFRSTLDSNDIGSE